jgi:hypothetical protein
MGTRTLVISATVFVGLALSVAGHAVVGGAQQTEQPPNFLVISQHNIPHGRSIEEATAEASQLVRDLRATKEFRSVRLYTHSFSSDLALYVLQEPNSWQAIRTGWDKVLMARPDLRTMALRWASHSDNCARGSCEVGAV